MGPLRSCLRSDVETMPGTFGCVVESSSKTVAVPVVLTIDH